MSYFGGEKWSGNGGGGEGEVQDFKDSAHWGRNLERNGAGGQG